jgi:hypothetical protein
VDGGYHQPGPLEQREMENLAAFDSNPEMAILTSRLAAKLEAKLTPEQMQEITPDMFDLVRDLVRKEVRSSMPLVKMVKKKAREQANHQQRQEDKRARTVAAMRRRTSLRGGNRWQNWDHSVRYLTAGSMLHKARTCKYAATSCTLCAKYSTLLALGLYAVRGYRATSSLFIHPAITTNTMEAPSEYIPQDYQEDDYDDYPDENGQCPS